MYDTAVTEQRANQDRFFQQSHSPPPLYFAVSSLHVAGESPTLHTSLAAAAAARCCFFDNPLLANSRPCTPCAPCVAADAPCTRKLSADATSHRVTSFMIRIPMIALQLF